VCGNGGVEVHADLARLRDETGCAFVMVGRAALADPWIFSGRAASRTEAAEFFREYAARLTLAGASAYKVTGRVKQLIRYWRAGGLFGDSPDAWLSAEDPLQRLEELR
jgi:tRNA-dihydrouridine synthase B